MRVRRSWRRGAPARAATLAAAALAVFSLCLIVAGASAAQSGRRQPKPISPAPTPSPAPEAGGESESQPRPRRADSGPTAVASFVVFEANDMFFDTSMVQPGLVLETFLRRLGKSPSVQVDRGGKRLTRGDAVRRAREEKEAHVVLLQLQNSEDTLGGDENIGRADPNRVALRIFLFAPQTGHLKYEDTIFQRAYRPTTTIGGVRVPLPTTGRVGRLPAEYRLEQAAQDAADRVMMRFDIPLPPDD